MQGGKGRKANAPVVEGTFHLDLVQKSDDARKNVSSPKHVLSKVHQVSDRMEAISNALLQLRCNQRSRLRLVQSQPSCQALLSEKPRLVHPMFSPISTRLNEICLPGEEKAFPAPSEGCA